VNIESETLDGGLLKLNLAGRLDLAGTQQIDLKFSAYASSQRAVIVDLAAVEFLASIGIRTLVLTAKTMASRGGKMVLLNPIPNVKQVLETAGIDTLIPIFPSLDAARAAFQA
jgi:anti-anti-sigma factor